jgi:CTP synthase
VAGLKGAGSLEEDPETAIPLLVLASCPVDNRPSGAPRLWGYTGTLAYSIYRQPEIEEAFNCNYELNPEFREKLEASGLKVSGVSENGGARIIELPSHPFFLATGFLPQISSTEENPHPMIMAFLSAVPV